MADDNVAADQLRLLIERIERLEEEKKGVADDIKDVYGEAKATGFDTKTMRQVVAAAENGKACPRRSGRAARNLSQCAGSALRSASHGGTDAMIITTTSTLDGRPVRDYLGLVGGEVIVGANVIKDVFASVTDFLGGRSGAYESSIQEARAQAMEEMEASARRLGADAILGGRLRL